jgi:hypothetical protein
VKQINVAGLIHWYGALPAARKNVRGKISGGEEVFFSMELEI